MKRINYTIILFLMILCFPFATIYGQGARYTGKYKASQAIQHVSKSNFVIEELDISGIEGNVIGLYSCENVIIRNNRFRNSKKGGIYLYNCKNVTIIDNTFENIHTALRVDTSQGIKFDHNDVYNVGGPLSESDGKKGNVVQFISVTGEGNSISYNVAENIYGESNPEDLISLFRSHGTPHSPIVVKGNWFRGGGPSPSGGGIILGDYGGSYQIAEDNILINPGQYGMAIAGGHNMTLRNNKVYGKRQSFSNVGFYAANWTASKTGSSHTITFEGNKVNYTNRDGVTNSWWIYENMEPVQGKSTNKYDPNLAESILPEILFGRARLGVDTPEPEPQTEPQPTLDSDPDPDIVEEPIINNDPTINIYLDKFNRICVISEGIVESDATVTVIINNKQHTQNLSGYHTAINYTVPSGSILDVFVKNGKKICKAQLKV